MERKTIVKHGRRVTKAALALLIGASVMQSCKDDDLILTGQPSWLGNSIYERLQDEGNYKYTLRLIDDLGETDVLAHTGSRTLFAASDSAYEAWFKTNSWGVSRYEDLNLSQKKLLLKNSMISNAYLLELMSNKTAEGDAATPEWGRTMRRQTSSSFFDSVYVMPVEAMPQTKYWEEYRQRGHGMPILRDATEAPMIHFLPAYLQYNKITAEDLNVLTNGRATSINEAWVNGVKVVNSGDPDRKKIDYDVTCKNGYIQKVEGVIESSPNMAEIIHKDPTTTIWSRLLDRFSAPYYYKRLSDSYNSTFGTKDSLFVLRYLSKNMWDWETQSRFIPDYTANKPVKDTKGNPVDQTELLSYDPGWNQYILESTEIDMRNDAGMMIVPTDDAMNEWWNGDGKELQDEYLTLDSVPTNIIAELINVNMLSRFSSFVPSKFESVLNDAKEPLGIVKEDVVGCYMGCNGVIYKVNKVFKPALFASVAYPALAHASTMSIVYYIIDNRNFKPYLLSMDSKYALILPSNNSMLTYLDPSSYGKGSTDENGVRQETPDILEIYKDPVTKQIKADRYTGSVAEDGTIVNTQTRTQSNVAANTLNKLYDALMDQMIIVIPDKSKTVEDYLNEGYNFFKTKGGSLIKASYVNNKLAFQGGWQLEHNVTIPTIDRYEKDNGQSYTVDAQVPMGAQKSVYLTLQEHPEFSSFLVLLENDYTDMLSQKLNNKYNSGLSAMGSKNLKMLDNYNYTVYVPTNEAIQSLQDRKILPTEAELDRGNFDKKTNYDPVLDSICLAEGWYDVYKQAKALDRVSASDSVTVRTTVASTLTTILTDFVRYHVQDHSLAIGMAHDPNADNQYESMKRNLETGRFYPLKVDFDTSNMTVSGVKPGNACHVVTANGLYNLICREYWFEGTNPSARLFMASDIVVHQIDNALMYDDMKEWREVVKEALNQ